MPPDPPVWLRSLRDLAGFSRFVASQIRRFKPLIRPLRGLLVHYLAFNIFFENKYIFNKLKKKKSKSKNKVAEIRGVLLFWVGWEGGAERGGAPISTLSPPFWKSWLRPWAHTLYIQYTVISCLGAANSPVGIIWPFVTIPLVKDVLQRRF